MPRAPRYTTPIAGSDGGTTVIGGEPIVVDPADVIGTDASTGTGGGSDGDGDSTGTRRRRGRPPGGGTKKKAPLDLNGVEGLLLSIHTMGAAILAVPELALDQTESKTLAQAVGNVARHYDISAGQKGLDHINLLMVAGMIYGTRALALARRRGKPAERPMASPVTTPTTNSPPRPNGADGNVVMINGQPAAPNHFGGVIPPG